MWDLNIPWMRTEQAVRINGIRSDAAAVVVSHILGPLVLLVFNFITPLYYLSQLESSSSWCIQVHTAWYTRDTTVEAIISTTSTHQLAFQRRWDVADRGGCLLNVLIRKSVTVFRFELVAYEDKTLLVRGNTRVDNLDLSLNTIDNHLPFFCLKCWSVCRLSKAWKHL